MSHTVRLGRGCTCRTRGKLGNLGHLEGQGWKLTLARSTRRVKFRPGEWFVRPDQPGGRVGILWGFIDHIVIASLALISSGLSLQNEILNRVLLF